MSLLFTTHFCSHSPAAFASLSSPPALLMRCINLSNYRLNILLSHFIFNFLAHLLHCLFIFAAPQPPPLKLHRPQCKLSQSRCWLWRQIVSISAAIASSSFDFHRLFSSLLVFTKIHCFVVFLFCSSLPCVVVRGFLLLSTFRRNFN